MANSDSTARPHHTLRKTWKSVRPGKFGPTEFPLRERFDFYVEKHPGCWRWLGLIDNNGYGKISVRKKDRYAHRVSWELHNGPIPSGMDVMHRCDNPMCTNPAHLAIGTHMENMRDMANKKRSAFGEKQGRAKLTDEIVRDLRRLPRLETYYAIAKRLGLAPMTVHAAINGKTWKHVR